MKGNSSSKRALICALFLFSSCSKQSPEWQLESANSCEPYFLNAKLYLEPENIFREAGVEIAYNSALGLRMYLNLFGCQLKSVDEKNFAEVIISIDGQEERSSAFVYQGNQKVLLTEELSNKIITALLSDHPVEIRVGNYYSKISSDGFTKKYRKLMKEEI